MILIRCLLLVFASLSFIRGQVEEGALPISNGDAVDINSLLDQIALLNSEKDSVLKENAEIKKKQNQLEKNIEHLTKKSSYVLELAKVEEKYDLLKTESEENAQALRNKIAQIELERDETKLEVVRLRERRRGPGEEADLAELQSKLKFQEETIAQYQATSERLTGTISELERRINELQATLQHVTSERDQLVMDVRSAGGAVSKAQKEAHVAKDRYVVAVKRLDEQSATIKQLELHHDKCRAVASQLETSISAMQLQLRNNNPFKVLWAKCAAIKRWILAKIFGSGKK